ECRLDRGPGFLVGGALGRRAALERPGLGGGLGRGRRLAGRLRDAARGGLVFDLDLDDASSPEGLLVPDHAMADLAGVAGEFPGGFLQGFFGCAAFESHVCVSSRLSLTPYPLTPYPCASLTRAGFKRLGFSGSSLSDMRLIRTCCRIVSTLEN